MLKLSEDISNTEKPTVNDPYGLFKNDIEQGDDKGSPLDALWGNDLYYAFYAVLSAARIQPSGARESVKSSDFLIALKTIINEQINSSKKESLLPIYNSLHGNVVLRSFESVNDIVDFKGVYFVKLNGQSVPNTNETVFNLLNQLPEKTRLAYLSTDNSSVKVLKNYSGLFGRASGGNASSIGSIVQDSVKSHDHQSNVIVQNDDGGQLIKDVRYEEVISDAKKISDINSDKNNSKSPRTSKDGGNETAPIHFAQDSWYMVLVDLNQVGLL